MSRIRKSPDVRKMELLEIAHMLFCEQGYTQTTVVDIVKKAGVAKGTFFYYFPTKEAALGELVNIWSAELALKFKTDYKGKDALTRLQGFICYMLFAYFQAPLLDKLWEENQLQLMLHILNQSERDYFNPLLKDIFSQGCAEGIMHIDNQDIVIDFFWSILEAFYESREMNHDPNHMMSHRETAISLLENLLGIAPGKFDLPEELLKKDESISDLKEL